MAAAGNDIAYLSAVDQAHLIRSKEFSPVHLVELYLERIAALNPKLDAFLAVAGDLALRDAERAEALVGTDEAGRLNGVVVSIKDRFDTAGITTTCGTAAWLDRVPTADHYIVRRLKQAGCIVIGKTNLPEFGLSVVSESVAYPPARNPWDTSRTTGGSSGGAGAAVVAGLCSISHGSDGGGSVRIPAACTGAVGLKPARGRHSNHPNFPDLFGSSGPLSRTVADAAAFLDATAGYDTGDAMWAPEPARPFVDEVGVDPVPLRIAWSNLAPVDGTPIDAPQAAATQRVAEMLEGLGHHVEQASPNYPPQDATTTPIRGAELHAGYDLPDPETFGPMTRIFYEAGKNVTAADYVRYLNKLQVECRQLVSFFDDWDVLVTPTVPIQPPLVGAFDDLFASPDLLPRFRGMAAFTMPWNHTGQPAITLPLYTDDDGLPIGLQFVGRPADEVTLFRLAGQLERAMPWHDRRPEVG